MLSPRQKEILSLIRNQGAMTIEQLSARFDLTTQTIRRDINSLSDLGHVRRFHGGVDLPIEGRNISASARALLNNAAKRAIARQVATTIEPGSTVFLGIGTTVVFVAEALKEHTDLTIVTNNLDVALTLCDSKQLEVQVTGGVMRHDDRDMVGLETIRFFEKFHASHAVLGAGSLSPSAGLLDFSYDEALITNVLIANSRRRILVADQTKWSRSAAVKVCPLDRIDMFFTDRLPADPEIAEALAQSQIEIRICGDARL